jgi:hypothetical protein
LYNNNPPSAISCNATIGLFVIFFKPLLKIKAPANIEIILFPVLNLISSVLFRTVLPAAKATVCCNLLNIIKVLDHHFNILKALLFVDLLIILQKINARQYSGHLRLKDFGMNTCYSAIFALILVLPAIKMTMAITDEQAITDTIGTADFVLNILRMEAASAPTPI